LVVGGTSGIGGGIALALAQSGSSVTVVGSSEAKGRTMIERMSASAVFPSEQQFQAHAADLLTVKGCVGLAEKLRREAAAQSAHFDVVAFTVGVWPDKEEPRTSDGVDKVIALDVLARFVVFRELLPILKPDAKVLSVLGSTQKTPPVPSLETVKKLLTGEKESYLTPQMLASAGVAADAWLQAAAVRHPEMTFVGTFPGIVATTLVSTSKTFPSCLRPILAAGQKLVALTPEDCGRRHAQILASPNIDKSSLAYFNVLRLEARFTHPLAYDKEFQDWVWLLLQTTLDKLQ